MFTSSDWIDDKHSLTTRFSILGDGKIGINTSTPTTNLYVQGSNGTSTINVSVSSVSSISVLYRSTIFASVNSGNQTITLADGVAWQRVVIINTSETNSLTISNSAGNITLLSNRGREFVYNGNSNTWYGLGNNYLFFYSIRLGPFSLDFKTFSTSSNLNPFAFSRIK